MKTLVVDKDKKLSIQEIDVPKYNEYQALVKVLSCGVCNGTDLKLIHGNFKNFSTYPAILGHEAYGEVIAVGDKVKKFSVGDRVLLPFIEENQNGFCSGWGGYSEYAVVGDYQAAAECGCGEHTDKFNEAYFAQTIVPKSISAVEAPMIITFREVLSAIRRFGFRENESVVIFGAGPVGLCFTKFASILGLTDIVTLDIKEKKLEEAKNMGAHYVFNSKDKDLNSKLRAIRPEGFDYVVDAVGISDIINQAMKLIKYNGKICCYGISSNLNMNLDWSQGPYNWDLHFVQWPSKHEEYLANNTILNWIETGILKPRDFISDVVSFDKILEGFEKVENRQVNKKMIIVYEEEQND